MIPHVKALEAAYQLHYYLTFKTHFLRPFLAIEAQRSCVVSTLRDVCEREQYHLLESDIAPDNLRLLLSLKPDQAISRAVKMIKGNTDRSFSLNCPQVGFRKLWSRGYLSLR